MGCVTKGVRAVVPRCKRLGEVCESCVSGCTFSFSERGFVSSFCRRCGSVGSFRTTVLRLILSGRGRRCALVLGDLGARVRGDVRTCRVHPLDSETVRHTYCRRVRECSRRVRTRLSIAEDLDGPLGRTGGECSSVNCERRATRRRGRTRGRCRHYGTRCSERGTGLGGLCSRRGTTEARTFRCVGGYYTSVCHRDYLFLSVLGGCVPSKGRRGGSDRPVDRRRAARRRRRCFDVGLLSLVRRIYVKRRFRRVSTLSFCTGVGLRPYGYGLGVGPERGVHMYCLVFLVDRGLSGRSESG